jgi:hypothetical protein
MTGVSAWQDTIILTSHKDPRDFTQDTLRGTVFVISHMFVITSPSLGTVKPPNKAKHSSNSQAFIQQMPATDLLCASYCLLSIGGGPCPGSADWWTKEQKKTDKLQVTLYLARVNQGTILGGCSGKAAWRRVHLDK